MLQQLARRAAAAGLASGRGALSPVPCPSHPASASGAWFLQSSRFEFSSDTPNNNNNVNRGRKGKGRPPKGSGRGRGGASAGAAGEERNVEWRQWIEKRLAELEEKGVLKKSELEKPAATSPTPARSGITRSPLNRAILKELKKLPAPDPETGFSEIGKRREEEEEEILEVLEAAMADAKDKDGKKMAAKLKEELTGAAELSSGEKAPHSSQEEGGSGDQVEAALDRLDDDPAGSKVQAGRINPNRLFFPGQKYELEELDPYTAPPEVAFPTRRRRAEEEITDSDDLLLRNLHFMNYDFLSRYVTEQGKILPRRKTGMKKKVQRKLVRTIKTARQMAILPINSREREEF